MSCVYFLVMHNPADSAHDFRLVKIGVTDGDVHDRIAQLQTGNPFELRCAHAFETSCPRQVEHFMHRTHAAEMHNLEWLRCPGDQISILVENAKEAARRFEDRKAKEDACRLRPSNGKERRADRQEFQLHREARDLRKKLLPAELRRDVAENQLKAATGASHGIRGIVRVKYVAATIHFSAQLAETNFPDLASRCRVEEISGTFRWRGVPRRSDFIEDYLSAKKADRKST